jgi:hypothetical protein
VRGVWMRGISGRAEMEASLLQQHIENIIKHFDNKGRPTFLMLQMPGITAHALMLLGYSRSNDGVDLFGADSNFPGDIKIYEYRIGEKSIRLKGYRDTSVPYLAFDGDFSRFETARSRACAVVEN